MAASNARMTRVNAHMKGIGRRSATTNTGPIPGGYCQVGSAAGNDRARSGCSQDW